MKAQELSVTPLDERRSHWIIETVPGAPAIEWDAEIISDMENERIGWQTAEGTSIDHAGSVGAALPRCSAKIPAGKFPTT